MAVFDHATRLVAHDSNNDETAMLLHDAAYNGRHKNGHKGHHASKIVCEMVTNGPSTPYQQCVDTSIPNLGWMPKAF